MNPFISGRDPLSAIQYDKRKKSFGAMRA